MRPSMGRLHGVVRQRPTPILELLESRQPTAGTTKLVGVDGHGGAGKSTFAELLARHLGAEIVHTDDFASWDNPKDWWPLLLERVLEPIAGGALTLSYPRSRWWPDHDPQPVVGQPVTPVMIVEGVSALREEFRAYMTVGVFIAAARDLCLRRGIERDASQGTRDEIAELWERYYADEEHYMRRDNPKGYADVVLDGSRPFGAQVQINGGPTTSPAGT